MCDPPPPTYTHFTSPSYATSIMHKYILMLQSNSTIINRLLNLNDFVIMWFMHSLVVKLQSLLRHMILLHRDADFSYLQKLHTLSKSPHVNGVLNIYLLNSMNDLNKPSSTIPRKWAEFYAPGLEGPLGAPSVRFFFVRNSVDLFTYIQ